MPAEKLRHLAAYEAACQDGQGGGYLRREGLYSSQITEWRKLRDGGALEGLPPGAKVGKLSAEQAEIARLRAQLSKAERRLARTEVALEIMGKHTRSWKRSPRARRTSSHPSDADGRVC